MGPSAGRPLGRIVNAMTVDVEDYFQVSAFDGVVPRSDWDRMESRVAANTDRLLQLFSEFGVRSTFFVLGWVADRHPALVRKIVEAGHELASHGYAHHLIYTQTPDVFRDDVRRAKRTLEDHSGRRVVGYRAPSYSITTESLWALDVLIEEGYEYDSSIFPVRHDRYGIPDAPRHQHALARRAGSLVEVPPATARWAGMNIPVAGGGYFRLLPYAFTRWGFARINGQEQRPGVFYLHPWEIDPDQPRLAAGLAARVRHYRNLSLTEGRLRRLLHDFSFSTVESVIALSTRSIRRLHRSTRPHWLPPSPPNMSMSAEERGDPSGPTALISGAPVVVSSQIGQQEWNSYVEQHPQATGDHLWEWREVFADVFGQRCVYFGARRGSHVVGVLPLVLFRSRVFGRFAVSVPFLNYGGLLADDAEVAGALLGSARQAAVESGASHVELRHAKRQFDYLPCREHKLGFLLTLPATTEELWKGIDRKIRNQVRKAQKEGLTVDTGGAENIDAFYEVFRRNMRDLGTPVYSKRLFQQTLALFPGQARVFIVRLGKQTLAGAVAIGFRDTVLVPWASSLREFRPLSPNTLLYWTMLERATADGRRVFDFGRSSPGGGTHQFKLQWGAQEVPLHWEYVMLSGKELPNQGPSNPKFSVAIAAWKKLPLWLATAVGPHLAKHLP